MHSNVLINMLINVCYPARAARAGAKLVVGLQPFASVRGLHEKVGFYNAYTRTRTFSKSARRFSEVGVVQYRRRVGIGILQGWLGDKRGLNWHDL